MNYWPARARCGSIFLKFPSWRQASISEGVVPAFECRLNNEVLKCDHSKETDWAVLSCGIAIFCAFNALQVHFRLRYNIFICSVILGELESFRNY